MLLRPSSWPGFEHQMCNKLHNLGKGGDSEGKAQDMGLYPDGISLLLLPPTHFLLRTARNNVG